MTAAVTKLNLDEALRYMGCPPERADPATRALAESCAGELLRLTKARVFLPGGFLNRYSQSLYGVHPMQFIGQVNFDLALIGTTSYAEKSIIPVNLSVITVLCRIKAPLAQNGKRCFFALTRPAVPAYRQQARQTIPTRRRRRENASQANYVIPFGLPCMLEIGIHATQRHIYPDIVPQLPSCSSSVSRRSCALSIVMTSEPESMLGSTCSPSSV